MLPISRNIENIYRYDTTKKAVKTQTERQLRAAATISAEFSAKLYI